MKFLSHLILTAVIALYGLPVGAQSEPVFVEGPHGGGAFYTDSEHKSANDRWGYAGAYRVGDFVFLSGVVAGAWSGEVLDDEAFKDAVRTTFRRADAILRAAGTSLEEVVDINSFHVWDSPFYGEGKFPHLQAVTEVKNEFFPEPDPAWTAVGVSGLLSDRALVEFRMVAYSPPSSN